MKKTFPILFMIFIFSSALTLQVVFDKFASKASSDSKAGKEKIYYEKAFNTLNTQTTNGLKIKLTERKEPIVILNFWASWCLPCIKEFQSINEMIETLGEKNVFVLGINSDSENSKKEVLKMEKKYKLKFPSTTDESGTLAERFIVSSIPHSLVYSRGKLIKKSTGEFDFMNKKFIESLKNEFN